MDELRFDGRVAIVTGAGGNPSLGRSYAMALAARGARVVVNDLGVGTDGRGILRPQAEAVAEEIAAAGGEAIADTNSVAERESARSVVQTALDAWGKVDIVVNNANVMHPALFEEVSDDDLARTVQVNLFGNIWMCRAVWPMMKQQGYGRIINISSGGMLGFPYSVIYGAAKAGIYGLTRGLAVEGKEFGIRVNALGPLARTYSTDHVYDEITIPGMDKADLSPDRVAPAVVYLAHEECAFTGKYISSAAGRVSEMYYAQTAGYTNPTDAPEAIRDNIATVIDHDGSFDIPDPGASTGAVVKPKPYHAE